MTLWNPTLIPQVGGSARTSSLCYVKILNTYSTKKVLEKTVKSEIYNISVKLKEYGKKWVDHLDYNRQIKYQGRLLHITQQEGVVTVKRKMDWVRTCDFFGVMGQ